MLVVGSKGIVDPFFSAALLPLPQQLVTRLGATSSYEAGVIRLLSGSANIADSAGVLIAKQRVNYMLLGAPKNKMRTEGGVTQCLLRIGLEASEVNKHLRRNLGHQGYYQAIALELLEFMVRRSRGQETLAFLHAYRFLEKISFVFPLLYAVRSAKYTAAFSTLREFFKGGVESELALLRKFQESSIDRTSRETPCSLDFSTLDALVSESAFRTVERCVPESVVVSRAFPNLVVQSGGLLDLLINLRNRYFHSSVSNDANISVAEIGDSDEFFAVVNLALMNWLGHIFASVLSERLR